MPVFATLPVSDLQAAAFWYQNVLGFKIVLEVKQTGETPGLIHLRRAPYQDLLLVPAFNAFFEEMGDPRGGMRLTFRVEEDLDELAARARTAGARVVEGPVDRPWNAREVTFEDPNGYRLTFTRMSWIPGIL